MDHFGNGNAEGGEVSRPLQRNRVRELRENRLMTQAQLARKAKVALRTIHSVEKGMNCRMDTKRKILLALGMRFEDKDYVFPPATETSMGMGGSGVGSSTNGSSDPSGTSGFGSSSSGMGSSGGGFPQPH